MNVEEYINRVISPKIQGDGGWIEFKSFEGEQLNVIFRGECSKCLILDRCIRWIESEIKRELSLNVKIAAQRKKPYFQDV